MSVIPSIFVRSPRTEAAQPLQVMFGTLSDTRTPSATAAAGASAMGASAAGAASPTFVWGASTDTGSDSEHPAMPATTPVASSIGTNRFTENLQQKNISQTCSCSSTFRFGPEFEDHTNPTRKRHPQSRSRVLLPITEYSILPFSSKTGKVCPAKRATA